MQPPLEMLELATKEQVLGEPLSQHCSGTRQLVGAKSAKIQAVSQRQQIKFSQLIAIDTGAFAQIGFLKVDQALRSLYFQLSIQKSLAGPAAEMLSTKRAVKQFPPALVQFQAASTLSR